MIEQLTRLSVRVAQAYVLALANPLVHPHIHPLYQPRSHFVSISFRTYSLQIDCSRHNSSTKQLQHVVNSQFSMSSPDQIRSYPTLKRVIPVTFDLYKPHLLRGQFELRLAINPTTTNPGCDFDQPRANSQPAALRRLPSLTVSIRLYTFITHPGGVHIFKLKRYINGMKETCSYSTQMGYISHPG